MANTKQSKPTPRLIIGRNLEQWVDEDGYVCLRYDPSKMVGTCSSGNPMIAQASAYLPGVRKGNHKVIITALDVEHKAERK